MGREGQFLRLRRRRRGNNNCHLSLKWNFPVWKFAVRFVELQVSAFEQKDWLWGKNFCIYV